MLCCFVKVAVFNGFRIITITGLFVADLVLSPFSLNTVLVGFCTKVIFGVFLSSSSAHRSEGHYILCFFFPGNICWNISLIRAWFCIVEYS